MGNKIKKLLVVGVLIVTMFIGNDNNNFSASEITKSTIGATIGDTFPDANLASCVASSLGKNTTDSVSQTELDGITTLTCGKVSSIEGIDLLTNVNHLDLQGDGKIENIDLLAGLTNLNFLDLGNNQISDISPLAGLINLNFLDLSYNQVSDISVLSGLTNLTFIDLGNNQISDISPLAGLTNLTDFSFIGQVIDLGAFPMTTTKIPAPISVPLNSIIGTTYTSGTIDYNFSNGETVEGNEINLNTNIGTTIRFEDGDFAGSIHFSRSEEIPTILTPGDSDVAEGTTFDIMTGVSAMDNKDGDITSSIVVENPDDFKGDGKDVLGSYKIIYKVTDSDGNVSTVKRTITVTAKPTINQPGDTIITEGDKLDILDKVSATDIEDGDLTSTITVSNPDNFKGDGKDKAGTYTITYTVLDSDGNTVSVKRIITVKDKPEIEQPGDITITAGDKLDILDKVSATDIEDGDLTSTITVSNPDNFKGNGKDAVGTYTITYTVLDSDGNSASVNRTITVVAKEVVDPTDNGGGTDSGNKDDTNAGNTDDTSAGNTDDANAGNTDNTSTGNTENIKAMTIAKTGLNTHLEVILMAVLAMVVAIIAKYLLNRRAYN